MASVETIRQEPIWPELQNTFGQWLANQFYNTNGWSEGFPSDLNVDIYNNTRLPAVWGAWNPQGGGGMGFLGNYLQSGYQMDPRISQAFQTALEWGGPAGQGTKYLNNMAQWGGTGGYGNSAILNMLNTGTPTNAGNPVLEMAKSGGSGEWGRALASRAYGGPSAAQQALQQFLVTPTRQQANFSPFSPWKNWR